MATEIRLAKNQDAPLDIWIAARRWLAVQDAARLAHRPQSHSEFDRAAWLSLWRPYWLAQRRIPPWLPLEPSEVV